jgi:glutathione S-transferase
MLIAEKGATIETIQIDLANGEQLTEAFRRINPRCTVPVLELDDGTRLLDSNSISLYLDAVLPGPNLTGLDAKDRAVIAMWQGDMEQNGFMAVAECFRNSAKGLHGRALTGPVNYEQIPELAERGRLRVRQFFANLNQRLGDSEFVAADRFTVADITAFVAVEFSRAIKEAVPDTALHLQRWRAAVASRPSAKV